jgi:hypothetical protein
MKTFPLIAALFAAGSASAAQVWVAPAAQKIRPGMTAPANAPTSASIAGAQNEFESFQVVVTGAASGVSMSLTSLDDGHGHSISGRDLVLYREAIINVSKQSGGDGATGEWPDALIPDVDPIVGEKRNAFPFDVKNGQSVAVFVDVHSPDKTPAGTYKGTLHVTGGATQDIPVSLTVWDFAIPSTSSLRSAYGMQWNGPCLGHGDSGCSNTDAEMQLRSRYVQTALDNRISIHQPYYTSTVDSGGNGNWAAFDKYAGPFLDGTADTRLKGAKLTSTSVDGAPNAAQNGAWSKHFEEKGWSPVLFEYDCDEPPLTCSWSDIQGRADAAHGANPYVPALVTTTADQLQKNNITGIDLVTPVVNFVEGKPGSQYAGNQRAGYPKYMWWYQSCMSFGCSGVSSSMDSSGETGWPTMAIDADATRNRAMEWLSFAYDIQGELYYETTTAFAAGNDPWTNQYYFGGNGDGTLFYPGTPAKIGGQTEIPVESLRMKMIRDGMEDYELMNLAKSKGLGDQAKQIAQGVYPKTYQATSTPAAIDGARAELAGLILHAMGKDSSSSNVATTASGANGGSSGGNTASTASSALASSGGGCSTSGMQQCWFAVPLIGVFALRRKKFAFVA